MSIQPNLAWPFSAHLGAYQTAVESGLKRLEDEHIIERIWKQDHTVWKPQPSEISNRLGWLFVAEEMGDRLRQLEALVFAARQNGLRHAVLLGMGGSSLAPELFSKSFDKKAGFLTLDVLDSTDPQAVLALDSSIDYAHTLFIVSTKSGGTVETFSFLKYFYRRTVALLGASQAGDHFIAITDPGSSLADIALSHHFRSVLLNDPNIGGRYSALSYFGLAPAAFTGLDLPRLLRSANLMAADCRGKTPINQNPAAVLGAILGVLNEAGRDKLTFLLSPQLTSFGDWVEQLIAESTGKEGKGILPVVHEPLAAPADYPGDRIFVSITLAGDDRYEESLAALAASGHPVAALKINDLYEQGGQFFLWELATAIAGYFMGINPFDQPNVEAAKVRARQMFAVYQMTGSLVQAKADLQEGGISAYGVDSDSLKEALDTFLGQARRGDYIAIQAFLPPRADLSTALVGLRGRLSQRSRLATTLGYGPRFLHSTGQLHKGDGGNGLFIQLTNSSIVDADIPDELSTATSTMSFGVLKLAQALGDQQALVDAGRRVLRLHIEGELADGIQQIQSALG